MTIKTWLLGSAALLSTLSGAKAADAVIAPEPEPVDYVRVCDVYGKGFYYIPGTESCFSFNGYVRFDTIVAGNPATNLEGDDYQVSTAVRSRLNFDVREETDLGTLRSFIRLQNTNLSGADNEVEIDQAFLQLGGLLAGYRDTMWSSGIGDIEDGLLTDTDLVVGDFNTNQINYTFAANGFSLTLGLEDDGTGDAVPDVHAKLVYLGTWGGAYLSAVYDETFNFEDARDAIGLDPFDFNGVETFPISLPGLPRVLNDGSNDAFALKGGVYLKDVLLPESQLKVEGHYAFDPTVYASIAGLATTSAFTADNPNVLNPTPGAVPIFLEWAAGAGYAQGIGKLGIAVSGQYGKTFDTQFFGALPNGQFGTFSTTGDYYAFVGNLGYKFTPNFASLAEVVYRNVDFDRIGDTDQVTGFLRFQRDF
ncbi:porin [Aureimonas sp. AU4]|uniref:porin n=1 Tax=Aureimonas sp. AU4 TaxID=1638163 RepID=UPI0007867623|nr:porin [Aureimonas sp. AU4]